MPPDNGQNSFRRSVMTLVILVLLKPGDYGKHLLGAGGQGIQFGIFLVAVTAAAPNSQIVHGGDPGGGGVVGIRAASLGVPGKGRHAGCFQDPVHPV